MRAVISFRRNKRRGLIQSMDDAGTEEARNYILCLRSSLLPLVRGRFFDTLPECLFFAFYSYSRLRLHAHTSLTRRTRGARGHHLKASPYNFYYARTFQGALLIPLGELENDVYICAREPPSSTVPRAVNRRKTIPRSA